MIDHIMDVIIETIENHPLVLLVIFVPLFFPLAGRNRAARIKNLLTGIGVCLVFSGIYALLHLNDMIYFENITGFADLFFVLKIVAIILAVAFGGVLCILIGIHKTRM